MLPILRTQSSLYFLPTYLSFASLLTIRCSALQTKGKHSRFHMADATKYAPLNSGALIKDLKTHFSLFKTKASVAGCAYGFIFVFIAFTIFLAFSPSPHSSSVWFTDIFITSSSNTSNSNSTYSTSSYESSRSHFSSIFYYIFPNSSSEIHNSTSQTSKEHFNFDKEPRTVKNQTQNNELNDEVATFEPNQSTLLPLEPKNTNITVNTSNPSSEINERSSILNNQTQKKEFDAKGEAFKAKKSTTENEEYKSLMKCNLYDGNWVRDESYPLYKPGSCSLIDEQFNCDLNGRPDHDYYKLKWKPKGCTLPRLNGTHMLELLRGKRLVFVGDSLNRNMWESLVCILRNSVKNQSKVYEEFGRHHFRGEASYSFIFEDYKCRVEMFVSPFLVQEWETADKDGGKKETLRLDLMGRLAERYKDADILVFNTGHWWTHEKTSTGKGYYQEGDHVYSELNVLEAFRKALTTWGRWVDASVNPRKTHVMFRAYSPTHFSGGQWNSGGQCDHETEPIRNDTYLAPYPDKMTVLEEVIKEMKTRVSYLNITRLSDYRKDGHPSMHRRQHPSEPEKTPPLMIQDCSHWCLPGVPDIWNELLYAEVLVKQMQSPPHL